MPNGQFVTLTRKSIRLPGYDYSSPGYYFITVRVKSSIPALSSINSSGALAKTSLGLTVQLAWNGLSERYSHVSTDTFSVQQDHIHGIVIIAEGGTSTLGDIVRAFKSISARSINEKLGRSGQSVWQRGYYERVIRNESELSQVRHYIAYNQQKAMASKNVPSDEGRYGLRPYRAQQAAPLPGGD